MILPYLIQKEFKQIFRTKVLPKIFIMMPLMLVTFLPFITTQEIKGIRFAVIDNDHSTTTSRIIQKLDASAYLSLSKVCNRYEQAMDDISYGRIDAIVEFPSEFEKSVVNGTDRASIKVDANTVNGTKGAMAGMYISQIIGSYFQGASQARLEQSPDKAMESSVRFMYNSNLDYKLYMTPGLFSVILLLIVGFLPALNIVSEKEKGTIEQINVTPISKLTFILSKLIPYIAIGLVMVTECILFAWIVHGITPIGTGVLTVLLFALVFCMLAASFGLIISNYSETISQAALTMYFFLVVFLLLSGLLTPISSMPDVVQVLTYLNPMRYIIEAFREIYLQGTSAMMFVRLFLPLCLYTAVLWFWAIKSYKKNS